MTIVFVYGSLKRGFGNHGFLHSATYIGPASVKGYEMYSLGGFPAIVVGEGSVTGEIYEVDEETLASLDMLEGHPTFYKRTSEQAYSENMNGMLPVLLYVYQHDVSRLPRVDDGVWSNAYIHKTRSHVSTHP